jgi:RecB family endonuclease NucS
MVKRHIVVLEKPDGGVEVYPMKQWLRENPQWLPSGMDPDNNTSHELRRALKSKGWKLEERPDQVLVIRPGDKGDTSFVSEVLGDELAEEQEITEVGEITFGLERDLQSALRANIEQLELGLSIIDEGKERMTDAGRIDITASDARGNIVVIELKAGTATSEVIAQVLAYMGALTEAEKKPTRGILVAGDFHKRVVLAARAIPNLELKKYSFQFTFGTVK